MSGEVKDFIKVNEITAGRSAGSGASASAPSVAFGDGDSGFYENVDDTLVICLNGTDKFVMTSNEFRGAAANSGDLLNEGSTATNPTLLPAREDVDSGIGWAGTDTLSLIAGAKEGLRLTEASNFIIASAATSANVGLTADAGSAQGNGVILASYNVYDTVGTAGDAATLPAAFEVGTLIYIKNGAAANSMDVFPASGDDLGAGANTQRALAAKDFAVYIGTTANATWEELMRGTCSA